MDIKPIETYYNGYRFRSRLEARWAVFFDTIGIKYEYEPEGFDMDGIKYLPDFYLPDAERWIEIKGKKLTAEELRKCSSFCEAQDSDGVKFSIFIGQPLDRIIGIKPNENKKSVEFTCDMEKAVMVGIMGYSYQWSEYDIQTPDKKQQHVENDHVMFFNPDLCEEDIGSRFMPMIWHDVNIKKEALILGSVKARQARFEHGETPT